MIKIIGKKPVINEEVEVYEATCPHCGTIFEFTLKECTIERRPNGNVFVYCPECETQIKRTREELVTKYTINKEDD